MNTFSKILVLIAASFFNLIACATKIPKQKGDYIPTNFIELIKLDNSLHLDIKYATNQNFLGKPVYTQARAFLQQAPAQALVNANKAFKKLGYAIVVFDGYRPWSVTKIFWDLTPKHLRKFVSNPKKGSRHNRGCAVDISLLNLKTGKQVEMPGEYDEMTERSYPYYKGGTTEQRKNRDLLIKIMEENGFKVFQYEWWHFDYKGWEKYKIEDIPFEKIK